MSDDPEMSAGQERDLLAAEYVLGLLTGAERMEARRLEGEDEAFGRAVSAWQSRLIPLAGEAPPAAPDPMVWDRIRLAIARTEEGARDNVVDLRRRLRLWRAMAAAATAAAAALVLVVGLEQAREEPPTAIAEVPARPPVMVAALASPEDETSLSVAYDAAGRILVVTPGRLAGASGHDHELWIIPAGGAPVSLGLVRAGAVQRVPVPAEVAPHFRARSTVALSVEPTGGSPTGQPTGPVVASGELVVV